MERVEEHHGKLKTFGYPLANHDANAIRPTLERLLTRSVNMGLSIGADTRSNRIIGTGTDIELSQLTLLVTLIDEGLIQPQD